MHILRTASLAFGLLPLFAAQLLACPTCKESLAENGKAGAGLALGLELSIYLMLAVPMLIFATLALVFTFKIRKAQRSGNYPSVDEIVAAAQLRAGGFQADFKGSK